MRGLQAHLSDHPHRRPQGKLLIVHSMGDERVLFQDTAAVVDKILQVKKPWTWSGRQGRHGYDRRMRGSSTGTSGSRIISSKTSLRTRRFEKMMPGVPSWSLQLFLPCSSESFDKPRRPLLEFIPG